MKSLSSFFETKAWFWTKVTIITAACIAIIVTGEPIGSVWFAIIALVLGFLFGKFTCNLHFKNGGVWVTILAFAGLNLIHSVIDGISIFGISQGLERILALIGHELIRQPTLYVIGWAILAPFTFPKHFRVITLIGMVTGVWLVGTLIGQFGGSELLHYEWLHEMVGYGMFLFIGDVIHHIVDEYLHNRVK